MNKIYSYHNLHKKYHHLWYGRCVVLLYHRVIDLKFDPQLLSVSVSNFKNHLEILKTEYNCLTINEFHKYLDSGYRIPKNSVVITFDDGYQDNYLNAVPILEDFKLQALFYISTGNINTKKEFWWDEVERILFFGNPPLKYFFNWKNFEFSFLNWNNNTRDELYLKILPYFRSLNVNDRNSYLNQLRHIFNLSKDARDTNMAMSLDELKKFVKSPSVVIGGHTVNHPSLAHLSYHEQFSEIQESIKFLDQNLNQKTVDFSYPFGTASNYNETTIAICKKLGLSYVAANFPKKVDKRTDKFQFPRFLVRNWSENQFKLKIKEYFDSDENFTY